MKKSILIIAALILIIPVLAACSSSGTTQSTSASTTVSSTQTASKPASTSVSTSVSTSKPASTTVSSIPSATTTKTAVSPKSGGKLREITVAVPSVIGWPPEITGANGETPQVCFDSFLRGDVDGNVYPWLAKSYKMAENNLSMTFELRDDVYFHDGSRLNAQVAKWNLDNQIAAKQQPYWDNVEVVGEYSVKINFKQWRNTMFGAFVDGVATWMCSKESFDKKGIDWMRQNPVGTGPFKFISFARDTSFIAEKNPNWWNKANGPFVDRYEILYVLDPTTQLSMMKVGDGDFVSLEPGKMAADLAGIGCELTTGIVSVFSLVPDTANTTSIWANQKFREAVEYAINRESIAKNLGYGFLKEPNQLPPRGNPNYNESYAGRKYDPAKAKELLAQSGYTSTTPVKIIVSPLAPNKDAVLSIQSYLSQSGIKVDLDFPEWSKFVTYLNGTWASGSALFQVFPVIGGANYNSTLAYYLDPTSGRLKSWQSTQEWVDLLNAACLSPKVDFALTRKCLDYIQNSALIIPVHESGRSYAYKPYVKGGDWMKRSMSSWKNIEKIWIDK